MTTAKEHVQLGIELLDAKVPNWRSNINTDSLTMSNGGHCILGQVYGSYEEALEILWPELTDWEEADRTAVIYGFQSGYTDDSDRPDEDARCIEYSELDQAWKEALADDGTGT